MITKESFVLLVAGVSSVLDSDGSSWGVDSVSDNYPSSGLPGSTCVTLINLSDGRVIVAGWRDEIPSGVCDENGIVDIFSGDSARVESP